MKLFKQIIQIIWTNLFCFENIWSRLRRRRDEVKQQFVKNRRSGEFGYKLDRLDNNNGEEISDNFDASVIKSYKDDTLDPTTADDHIKHNLRPLIRKRGLDRILRNRKSDLKSFLNDDVVAIFVANSTPVCMS